MSRLESVKKAGYYPTPTEVTALILGHLQPPDGDYRWLDPCRGIVERIRSQSPQPLIISASKPVFFYARAAYGKDHCSVGPCSNNRLPKAIWVPMQIDQWRACRHVLRRAEKVVWVYHTPYGGPISGCWQKMTREMERYGFRVSKTEPCLELSPALLRFHPRFKHRKATPLDSHRLVLVYFTKGLSKNKSSEATLSAIDLSPLWVAVGDASHSQKPRSCSWTAANTTAQGLVR